MESGRIGRKVLQMAATACAAVLLLTALASRSSAQASVSIVSIVSAGPATGVAGSSNTVVIKGLSSLTPLTVSVGSSYFMPTVAAGAWTLKYNAAGLSNGQYLITAKATDSTGHAVTATKYLIIANGATGRSYSLSGSAVPTLAAPAASGAKSLTAVAATAAVAATPTVVVTAPASNATVSGSYKVYGTAAVTGGTIASVAISVDGGAAVAATGTSSWSYTLNTTARANGTHTISVTAKSAAAKVSVAKVVTFKTSNVPTVAISAPASEATVSGSVSVAGTSAETGGAVASVSVSVDGGAYAAATGSTNWSYALNTTARANGAHTISVKAVDAGGNASVIATRTIKTSNTPTVAITAPASEAAISGTADITGTSAEAGGTVATVSISVNGGAYVSASGTTNWSHDLNTLSPKLNNGANSVSVKAVDAGGNSSAIVSRTFQVDNAILTPTIAITSPANGATVSGAVKVSGTAAETGGTIASVSVSVDGGAYASASGTASWSFTLSSTLTNGAHTVTAKAVDAVGNSKLTPAITITVANSYPVSGTLAVSGSNTCTTSAATCSPGAAWSGTASICDTSAGICGTLKTSGNGSQAVSATVAFTKSGLSEGSAAVSGSVTVSHTTTCGQDCNWVPVTCYDDDGNPYDCGYYDCYNACTEKVTGSGILTGTLK